MSSYDFNDRLIYTMRLICVANDDIKYFDKAQNNKSITPLSVYEFCKKYKVSADWLLGISKDNAYEIKKCENCGKPFHTTDAREKYCNRKNENGRTCKDTGYENTMNDIDKAYRKEYKTKNAYKNRNLNDIPNIQALFDEWVYKVKSAKQELSNSKITKDDYLKAVSEKLIRT